MRRLLPLPFALFVIACGGAGEHARGEAGDPPPSATPVAPGCTGVNYRPPPACFVDDNALVELSLSRGESLLFNDADAMLEVLGAYPVELNRGECDPAEAAVAIDFSSSRVWAVRIESIGVMRVPLEPTGFDCTSSEAVRVHVNVDAWCGGTEVSPGWMILVLPADPRPVELVNDGNPTCTGERPP